MLFRVLRRPAAHPVLCRFLLPQAARYATAPQSEPQPQHQPHQPQHQQQYHQQQQQHQQQPQQGQQAQAKPQSQSQSQGQDRQAQVTRGDRQGNVQQQQRRPSSHLAAWDPFFDEFDRIERDFMHNFRHFGFPAEMTPWGWSSGRSRQPRPQGESSEVTSPSQLFPPTRTWAPRVDITENDSEITLHAELAGVRKEDVKIHIRDNVLTIEGERKFEKKDEDPEKKIRRVERSYGSFSRKFTLPENVDLKSIKATYKDGVLNLSLAKLKEEPKADTVHIPVE